MIGNPVIQSLAEKSNCEDTEEQPFSRLSNDDQQANLQASLIKCSKILPLLISQDFKSKYFTTSTCDIPDCYVFLQMSSRGLVLEANTRFDQETQAENLHTYKFVAHKLFEDKLNLYTRHNGVSKPNPNLVRSRTWDVGLCVVMKVEAISKPFHVSTYLLKREYKILEFIWNTYLGTGADISEMTGIPIVFEYQEVPNNVFTVERYSNHANEIDEYGRLTPMSFPTGMNHRSTLSYMTMEKMGPNVAYLQQLVRAAQVTPASLDLWTAFKIFDQLICRVLQVQRLGVVHNDICPENIYLGHGVTFNVVYLNNFKRSYIVDEAKKSGPTDLSDKLTGSSLRFASMGQLSARGSNMSPLDDVESAFYVLIAMLSGDYLPWDMLLQEKRTGDSSQSRATHNVLRTSSILSPNNTGAEEQADRNSESQVSNKTVRKLLNVKQRFWQTPQILNVVISSCHCVFAHDKNQGSCIASLLRDVYNRIRDWRQEFATYTNCALFCKQLSQTTSQDYRQFMDLRKCGLVYFEFAETFGILNDIVFRNKVSSLLKNDSVVQQAWNAFVWCFNNIEIRTRHQPDISGLSLVLKSTPMHTSA